MTISVKALFCCITSPLAWARCPWSRSNPVSPASRASREFNDMAPTALTPVSFGRRKNLAHGSEAVHRGLDRHGKLRHREATFVSHPVDEEGGGAVDAAADATDEVGLYLFCV